MRWLFLLLMVLNLLLYVHHVARAPISGDEIQKIQITSRDASIKLLAEGAPPARRALVQEAESGCFFLGGFDDVSGALLVVQRLLSLDIESSVEPMDMAAGVDYWVYLPPLMSRQASLRQLRELQSRNIDSYIITVGELANGISLGIFSRKDSAGSVVSRLESVDYAAQIKELPRTHRRYWVRVTGSSRDLLNASLLEELLRDFPALEHRQMPCTSVATSR